MYTFTSQRINPDALNQSDTWYDGKGNRHEIKDMSYPYVKAVINFLYKKCWKMNPHNTELMRALKTRRSEAIAEMQQR